VALELADLEVVRRQLMRFRAKGTLTAESVDRLLQRLTNYRRELLSPKQAPVQKVELVLDEVTVTAPVAGPVIAPVVSVPPTPVEKPIEPPVPVAPPPASLIMEPFAPQPTVEIFSVDGVPEVAAAAIVTSPESDHVAPAPFGSEPVRVDAGPPAPPKKSWTEILAAFMEERNIHWGEVVGGLLVVCSSTALVVSFWESLKSIHYFQTFIFVTITSAIFGVGLYAHHRWKLASTSRGILVIATLLVPLNFAAMAAMSSKSWTDSLIPEVISLAIFTWLVTLAARVIAGDASRWLSLAVLGNSAAALAIVPLATAQSSAGRFLTMGGACVGLFAVTIAGHLHRFSGGLSFRPSRARLDGPQCGNLFMLLGVAAFSTAVAVGLLIIQVASRAEVILLLHRCSPLAALLALTAMASGLTVQRGARRGPALDSYRLAGTAVGVIGLAGMLAAVGLAWPHPWWIIAVCVLNTLALVWAAFRWRMPLLHIGAIACAALAYLTAFHLVAGDLKLPVDEVTSLHMLQLTLSARSGTALGGLFLVLAVISEWLARVGFRRHAVYYVGGCAAAAVAGLILTTYHGFTSGGNDALRAAILYGVYGGGALLLAARWRRLEFSYLGLVLIAAVLPWGFAWHRATSAFGPHWGLLLAIEATIMAAAAFALNRKRRSEIYVAPLMQLGEGVAWPAIGVTLAAGIWEHPLAAAVSTLCAAAVYLILAANYRSPWRVWIGQGLLSFASLFTAVGWLKYAGWIKTLEAIADSPRSVQVFGIALMGLSLVWIAARYVVSRLVGRRAQDSLVPPYLAFLAHRYSVDRVVRHVVIAGQFGLLAVSLLPAVQDELIGPATAVSNAFGPAAWLLTGLSITTLLAALWDQWREEELVTTLLLAAIVPGLIAGRCAVNAGLGAPAAASALRWGLGIVLLVSSVAIWQRVRIAKLCRSMCAAITLEPFADKIARAVTLITTAAPVLLITVSAAMLQLGGTAPCGPAASSFFANIGPTWSYLVPLALVIVALVGHALRERLSGYAFSAGLVLELAVTLGYSLRATLNKQPIDTLFFVSLLQWATITAGVWAIVWLVARRFTGVWREDDGKRLPGILMHVQIGMAVAGNAILLGLALVELALFTSSGQAWCVAAGHVIGWTALILAVVAIALRGRLRPNVAGLVGLSVMGLLACTVRGLAPNFMGQPVDPIWGYRTLMLGWAFYALIVVLAAWWAASLRPHLAVRDEYFGPPQALLRMAGVWVRAAAILAVLLGLKAAFLDNAGPQWSEQLWAAAAIAVASGAGATMAVWRRREGWAFATAWGVNLAASIIVWHFELLHSHSFEQYWLRLVQANVIATASVALVWLAARKRLYELRELSLGTSPLLALQVAVAALGNAALLVAAVFELLVEPQRVPQWMTEYGDMAGWLGLLLTSAAAGWYLHQTLPGNLVHALGGLLLGAGVLAACGTSSTASTLPLLGEWPAYHVLQAAWTAAGAVLLAAVGISNLLVRNPRPDGHGGLVYDGRQSLLGESQVEGWIVLCGVLATGLALGDGIREVHRPWWPAGAILAISAIAAVTALWRRKVDYVYASSVLINAAGILIWRAHQPVWLSAAQWMAEIPIAFLMVNVLGLAAGSAIWSVLGRLRQFGEIDANAVNHTPPHYCIQAAWLGTTFFAVAVALGTAIDLSAPHAVVKPLDWIALASIAAAAGICLWHRSPRPALQMFYCLGLATTAMWLWSTGFAPQKYSWAAGGMLACYTLSAAVIGWLLPRLRAVWSTLRVPVADEQGGDWFSYVQAVAGLVAAALAIWISTDATFNDVSTRLAEYGLAARMAGPLALLVLLGTAIVMAAACKMVLRARSAWQMAFFACGLLLGCCLRWSQLSPAIDIPWLHGSIAVIVSGVVVTLVAGVGLKLLLPRESDWIVRGRQFAPYAAALAGAMTFVVLLHEAILYKPGVGVPIAYWEIAIVGAMFIAMTATGIAFAVTPEWDPLRYNARQRQIYVYLAEAIGLLLGFHLRYTMPWLFKGFFQQYWMFVVLGGAFLGAGLSEWFHRRKTSVLAVPLERTAMVLPLLPAVAFWIMPDPTGPWSLVGRSPLMWFMMALFYTTTAVTRRSLLATVLAVLTGNLGLWTVLHETHISFFQHPQVWLIPIALAALAAEHLNRHRVAEPQRLAVRYTALSVIYISSTADMYIAGLADWRLALVLMVLSVAGILLGISLRVRSFLYLGLTFLVVDLASMLWYAAVMRGNTWVWYASGIALGAAIIALFAVFEKRRNDVLAAVEQLKVWQR
jgi:hypothetical protein